MDQTGLSIVAQTCLKVTGEVYASIGDVSQGFQPDLFEQIYKAAWRLHDSTMRAQAGLPPVAPQPPVEDPGAPFGPPPQQAPVAVPPAPVSQPVVQPSPPQAQAPACPECQTEMVKTENWDAIAAAVAKKTPPGKPPPYWKCPRGTYDKQTRTAYGCQGCQWDAA